VAACGVPVAKMSGRGLAHTGGTLDKLESIEGFRTRLGTDEFLRVLDETGLVLAGQTAELAPADAGMYALRDVTATVDSIPLIAASIMSKKLAVGAASILLDVKTGGGALIRDFAGSRRLARLMVQIGRDAGRRTAAMVTDMDEPLGRAAGNALEVKEAIEVLGGGGPADLRALCLDEAAHLLDLAVQGVGEQRARTRVERAVTSGAALAQLRRTVAAQGGDPRHVEEPSRLPAAPVVRVVRARRAGFVGRVDALAVGRLVMGLGAGRATKHDAIRHDTGVRLLAVHGHAVARGDPLAEVHAGSEADAERAEGQLLAAIAMTEEAKAPRRYVHDHVGLRDHELIVPQDPPARMPAAAARRAAAPRPRRRRA